MKKYQSLSKEEEEEKKKWQNGCERYKNLQEGEKQLLVEYRKILQNDKKNALLRLLEKLNAS